MPLQAAQSAGMATAFHQFWGRAAPLAVLAWDCCSLSHTWYVTPKWGKWVAQSKVPGTEQALSKWGDRFSWAFRKPAPQCNVRIIVLVTSNDTCHSSAAPSTTIPLHPFLFRICTAAMSQPLTIPQSPKPILSAHSVRSQPSFRYNPGSLQYLCNWPSWHPSFTSILTTPVLKSQGFKIHPPITGPIILSFQLLNTHLDHTKSSFYSQTLSSLLT